MTDKPKKQEHPLYNALTHQIGAALLIARKIATDCGNDSPPVAKKFLELFDKKQAQAQKTS